MLKINLPENVKYIIQVLEKAGCEAYVVGGPVRDSILGMIPDDWDITTSASPEQVKKLFRRTVDTGIEHGTVTVLLGKESFEVTTYRLDGEYKDHRRPEQVAFTASLKEDLYRRDFTINAMAYNESEGLVDLCGGLSDLQQKLIRCVGKAQDRFNEDALRILRALRFQAQLNFSMEEKTQEAICEKAEFLKEISAERIQVELSKLITSNHPEVMEQAYDLGVTKIILPEFDAMMETPQENAHHCFNVGVHTIESMKKIRPSRVLRYTMLFHDMGKPGARKRKNGVDHFKGHQQISQDVAVDIMNRLKFDNRTKKQVAALVLWHDVRFSSIEYVNKTDIRRWAGELGADLFSQLLDVQEADLFAQSSYRKEEKQQILLTTKRLFEEIREDGDCLCISQLAIGGRDLMKLGIAQGKAVGEMLKLLLNEVLERPDLNTKEQLSAMAEEKRKEL